MSPETPSTGATENASAEQTVAVFAATTGVGFIVTTTLKVEPTQVPLVGVTTYVTEIAEVVVLVRVPLKLASFVPKAKPVIPVAAAGADQLYVVVVGTTSLLLPSTGETVNADAEQVAIV